MASLTDRLKALLRWRPGRRPAPLGTGPDSIAQQFHTRILDGLSEGVLVFSTGGRLLYWNPAAARLLGRTFSLARPPADWITLRPDGSRMPPDETPVARVHRDHTPVHDQLLGDISPSGVLRWLMVSAEPLERAGQGRAVLVHFTDHSERRRAEQEVRRYRERLEVLVEVRTHEAEDAQRRFANFIHSAPIPICVFDNEGVLTIANQRFWDTFGYTPEQVPGLAEWWQLAYPDPEYRREVARMWLTMQRKSSHSEPGATAEQRVCCAGGRVLTMEISAVTLEDGYLATFVDVSSRHESAERVREIAELNLSLIESSTQGMALYRQDGTCLLANEAAASLLGQSRQTLLHTALHAMSIWRNSGLRAAAELALATRQAQTLECEVMQSRQSGLWIAVHIMPFSIQAEKRLLLMFDDITVYRAQEFRLKEDKRVAEEANKVKSTFLASMSHEIRNPLNAIMGMAEVLKDDRLDPDQQRVLETISAAGKSLLSLVNDVLDFAKIEAGRLELEPQVFSVEKLLLGLVQVWQASAEQKGLRLLLAPLPPLPAWVLGDAQRVLQILTNYVSNAIKFTGSGEVRIGVAELKPHQQGEVRLRLHVSDTGAGIPPDELHRVFDAFTQLEDAATVRNSGSGLGLAICRELATLLNGRVGVESQPGRGSTFWVEVPLQQVDSALGEAPVNAAAPLLGNSLLGLQVLIVDDTPVNLEVAARLLAREGANVRTASSGEQALAMLQGPALPDLLLLDVQMPGMDGLDVARRIRTEAGGEDLAILALSAGTLPVQREAARQAGMDDFIAKPFELHEMVASIQRALQLRQKAQPRGVSMENTFTQEDLDREDVMRQARSTLFPDMPGHDLLLAWRRMGGDSTLYLRSLRLFDAELQRAEHAIRGLATASDVGEVETLRRAVHRLKGASGMVACSEVHRLANHLEQAMEMLNSDVATVPQRIREHLVQLQGSCERQRAGLQASLLLYDVALASGRPDGFASPAPSRPQANRQDAGAAGANPFPAATAVPAVPLGGVESLPGTMISLSGECKENMKSLIFALVRHDLQALELFDALPPTSRGGLPEVTRQRVRLALDRLAFEEASQLLQAALDQA